MYRPIPAFWCGAGRSAWSSWCNANQSKAELNNRIVLLPQWRDAHLEEASDLPGEVRAQVENFFVSTAKFTDKQVRIKGWASARKAMRFIDDHRKK